MTITPDKMKRRFFQAAVVSILLYGRTTWTQTKRLQKKLDGNCTRMLRAILNKSWRQHPTRPHLYGHLPPITKTIQVRRTRHAGHCWRSKDELIRDILLWTSTHGHAKAGRPARTYIQQLCEDTGCCPEDLSGAMNDREEWRERVRNIRATSTTWWWWFFFFELKLLWCETDGRRETNWDWHIHPLLLILLIILRNVIFKAPLNTSSSSSRPGLLSWRAAVGRSPNGVPSHSRLRLQYLHWLTGGISRGHLQIWFRNTHAFPFNHVTVSTYFYRWVLWRETQIDSSIKGRYATLELYHYMQFSVISWISFLWGGDVLVLCRRYRHRMVSPTDWLLTNMLKYGLLYFTCDFIDTIIKKKIVYILVIKYLLSITDGILITTCYYADFWTNTQQKGLNPLFSRL